MTQDILKPKTNEFENNMLGVREETSTLKKVLMWGPPGVETVLGQLLPTTESCFQTQFDVLGARDEIRNAKLILDKQGVEVISVKDELARMIVDRGFQPQSNLKQLKQKIAERAVGYAKKYKYDSISNIEEVLPWVDVILEEDIQNYSENVAILINEMTCLNSELPLSNLMYARDQSNVLGNTIVWSSMRHLIRQPEVSLFKTVLNYSGILENSNSNLEQIQIRDDGKFEGGDAIANDGIYYIGVGGRTNISGVLQAAESIIKRGGRVMIPFDEQRDLGENEMDAMHLDTYWMPVSENQIVACEDEVNRRRLFEIVANSSGKLESKDIGWFADHLEKRGVELIPLTTEEQRAYAPNFLNLGNKTVVLSLAKGNNLTGELQKRGFTVHNADLQQVTKGFGGLHCSTAAIQRG